MLPTTLMLVLADPAGTTEAVGAKVGIVVPKGVVAAEVTGAAVVVGLELLPAVVGTVVVEAAVVVVNDPGSTVPGATVP